MRLLIGLACVVAVLATGGVARASGPRVTGDWGAYAAIASHFHAPLPAAYVHNSDCPDDGASDACADPASGEAWIPAVDLDQFTLAHEMGHLFDAQYLT